MNGQRGRGLVGVALVRLSFGCSARRGSSFGSCSGEGGRRNDTSVAWSARRQQSVRRLLHGSSCEFVLVIGARRSQDGLHIVHEGDDAKDGVEERFGHVDVQVSLLGGDWDRHLLLSL